MTPSRQHQQQADEHRYLVALERVERAMLRAETLEGMLRDVLDEMLDIFECDRAWLLFPCDPEAESFTVPMERTRPEWPGAAALGKRWPMDPFTAANCTRALKASGPYRFDPEHDPIDPDQKPYSLFHIKSMMMTCVRPHTGKPWVLGIHHCARPRVYDRDLRVFASIGARMADGLGSLLSLQALQSQQRQLEQAQRLAQVGSFEWDGNTKMLSVSRVFLELLGLPEAAQDPRALLTLVSPDHRNTVQQTLMASIAGQRPFDLETHVIRKDGQQRLMRLHGQVETPQPSGEPVVTGILQDITEATARAEKERQLEQQLRQAQKMEAVGQLTGGVAHDFNNMLTVMMASFEIVTRASDSPPRVSEAARQGLQAAQRAADLTHRLLAFSRKQALTPETVDLNRLIADLENLLRRTLGETIDIEVIKGAGLWYCNIDRSQMENVLLNLAINARDAMPDGGRLTIETANSRVDEDYGRMHEVDPGQYVLLAVTDGGKGMPPDVAARAFDPFFTTKETGRGSGLGLSTAYGFVKQSGGHVKLYSEPDRGTTVKVYLPRQYGPVQARQMPPPVTDIQGRNELVVVVEDEDQVLQTSVATLEGLGYLCIACSNGAEALQAVQDNPDVALLFTDVILPGGITGVDLARRARTQRPDLRVLFTSGYTENAIIHHGHLDHGVELLEKPFTRDALGRRVRQILDSAVQPRRSRPG